MWSWVKKNWSFTVGLVVCSGVTIWIFFRVAELINSPQQQIQTQGADWVNYLVAVGTIILAFVTFLSQIDSKKSIKAAEVSSRATEKSVERMQDSLRPHFDLDVFYQSSGDYIGLLLMVRNVGVGPGIIRLVTARSDVSIDALIRPVTQWKLEESPVENNQRGKVPLVNAVFEAGEGKVLFLGRNTTEFSLTEGEWVSSLSVFYEDVYGRYFRTRIIYQLNTERAQVIGKETFDVQELPINPMVDQKIDNFRLPEGSAHPVVHRSYSPMHLLGYAYAIKNAEIKGTDFTKGTPIRVLKYSFDRLDNGFPALELQVGKHKPFTLRRQENRQHNRTNFSILPNDIDYAEHGLHSLGGERDIEQIANLYQYVFSHIEGVANQ